MNKEHFKQKVREELRKIPLETRHQWNDTDLFFWWMKTKSKHPSLTWEKCPGDLWQQIPGMCNHMIGRSAPF